MKYSKEDIEIIASLAKIQLSEKEKLHYQEHLSEVIGYFDKMDKLTCDLSFKPGDDFFKASNAFERLDEIKGSLPIEKVISLSPKVSGSLFSVPKVKE